MKQEKSCGIVVIKDDNIKLSVLLIKHNMGHWGIPKGHVEDGETEQETALREVFEETGIESEIVTDFREVISYSPKEGVLKDVVYFLGKPLSDDLNPQLSEVSKVVFLTEEEALDKVIHDTEKELLCNAIEHYKKEILKN